MIEKARIILIRRDNGIWGYALLKTETIVDKDAPTSYTDGRRIVLAERHVEDPKTGAMILAHELAHFLLLHPNRIMELQKTGYPHTICNIAADVIANAIVYDIFGKIPESAAVKAMGMDTRIVYIFGVKVVLKKKVAEYTLEELTRELAEKLKNMAKEIQGYRGEEWENHEMNKEIPQDMATRISGTLKEAADMAKKDRGTLPADIEEAIRAAKVRIRLNIRDYITNWTNTTMGYKDYTFRRPNKRKLHIGYMPRPYAQNGEAVVILDTSGSMDARLLSRALGVIRSALMNSGVTTVTLIQNDAKIQKIEKIPIHQLREKKVKGRGGTVFREALEYVEKRAKAVIVITDGYIDEEEFEKTKVKTLIISLEAPVKINNPRVKVVVWNERKS